MKFKVCDLFGRNLDLAVALAEGVNSETFALYYEPTDESDLDSHGYPEFHYSTIVAQAWAIIEREKIDIRNTITEDGYRDSSSFDACVAHIMLPNGAKVFNPENVVFEYGPTALIAAMRCFVTAKFGEFVELPEEALI